MKIPTSAPLHVAEVLKGVPHVGVHLIKVVHEAQLVHLVGDLREVPTDLGVETGQLGGGGQLHTRDVPVRKVPTKDEVWDTLSLYLSRVVHLRQKEKVFFLLTDQAGLVSLPVLPFSRHGDLDEVPQGGQVNTELGGETGQSEQRERVS